MAGEKIADVVTADRVRDWLTNSSEGILMKSGHPKMCPIFCYLRFLGFNVSGVYPSGVNMNNDGYEEDLSLFGYMYIEVLDNSIGRVREITREEALSFIDKAQKMVNMLTDRESEEGPNRGITY